ncbi:NAD(FAD)-utilizing dehydrogenase [Chelatococcus reniformis]|uniref:NAD(FAD)-utilizing dehydrogenase n=1 Tax=Chelatococcus reniformis TaxID=1494448 RepID=A0A916TXH7_9HYPH|nr:TIGR03862 family flavoprotein [Chelatococcus reniformis]GGC48345.1 NAD(FAD)-utilizing dehydrogenase [Chelatococcus reniformis]
MSRSVAIIGAGPAGLMAAEVVARAGHHVVVYERMPSPARKFLMAGRGGLNLTHSEPLDRFVERYGPDAPWLAPAIRAFPPEAVRAWCQALGQPTFVGSSGRVFPHAFKASPLLRAWLGRLADLSVELRLRHTWRGWSDDGALLFEGADGAPVMARPDACVLALGGASWPRLGADGSWTAPLMAAGIPVTALAPANSGLRVAWTPLLRERHAGTPLKRIALTLGHRTVRGEAVITEAGLEGGAVYALTRDVRAALDRGERPLLHLDLRPDLNEPELTQQLGRAGGRPSLPNRLRKASLPPVAAVLLREAEHRPGPPDAATVAGVAAGAAADAAALARCIKAVPIPVDGLAGLARAISTAGGIPQGTVDARFMLRARPGTFVAGEMLDWEAPTGGYLLQATLATGAAAGRGLLAWLGEPAGDTATISHTSPVAQAARLG